MLAAAVLGALLRAALARSRPVPHARASRSGAARRSLIGVAGDRARRRARDDDVRHRRVRPAKLLRPRRRAQPAAPGLREGRGDEQGLHVLGAAHARGLRRAAQRRRNIDVDAADESPAVLISDLHGNTLALDALERLFADRPVFFAGDLGHAGTRAEAQPARAGRLAAVGTPVVAVSGNHDSRLIMRRLAAEGAIVLTDTGRLRAGRHDRRQARPATIEHMKVAGWPDPHEYRGPNPDDPDRIFSFSELPDGDRATRPRRPRLVAWFDGLPERPDVVMVHQNGLAQHLAKTLLERGDDERAADPHRPRPPPARRPLRAPTSSVVDAGTGGAGGVFGVGTQSVGHRHPPAAATAARRRAPST